MPEPVGEARSLDIFGNDETGEFRRAACVKHGHNVRVVEPGDHAGFAQVGSRILRARQPAGMRDLDRHRPVQLVITGQKDHAEAAHAQQPLDAIPSDALGNLFAPRLMDCEIGRSAVAATGFLHPLHRLLYRIRHQTVASVLSPRNDPYSERPWYSNRVTNSVRTIQIPRVSSKTLIRAHWFTATEYTALPTPVASMSGVGIPQYSSTFSKDAQSRACRTLDRTPY